MQTTQRNPTQRTGFVVEIVLFKDWVQLTQRKVRLTVCSPSPSPSHNTQHNTSSYNKTHKQNHKTERNNNRTNQINKKGRGGRRHQITNRFGVEIPPTASAD
jgi:hypothetical protein